MSKEFGTKESCITGYVAVRYPFMLCMLARIQHFSALFTLEAVGMPVIPQGLSPLCKIDRLLALLAFPHYPKPKLVSSEIVVSTHKKTRSLKASPRPALYHRSDL